jgi:hypothetical protein
VELNYVIGRTHKPTQQLIIFLLVVYVSRHSNCLFEVLISLTKIDGSVIQYNTISASFLIGRFNSNVFDFISKK